MIPGQTSRFQVPGEDADAPDSTWLALHVLLVKQEQGNALQKQLQLLDDSAGLQNGCFQAVCWDEDPARSSICEEAAMMSVPKLLKAIMNYWLYGWVHNCCARTSA